LNVYDVVIDGFRVNLMYGCALSAKHRTSTCRALKKLIINDRSMNMKKGLDELWLQAANTGRTIARAQDHLDSLMGMIDEFQERMETEACDDAEETYAAVHGEDHDCHETPEDGCGACDKRQCDGERAYDAHKENND